MTNELNKWQIGIKISKSQNRIDPLGWNLFHFYILKFISFPPEGESIAKNNYKGFRIMFMFWLPFDI